ncbi:MAG: GNAT family N-acetyltransferase, partial [Lachnospiraceae bacterium]|nr:GNAT family N-acetyltransferase [Lachnospiraceae bacterium]
MVRKATKEDIPRIAEIIIFGKRVAYRPIFQDDVASFNEFLVVPLAEEYQRDITLLDNMLVYDDRIVKGVINANPTAENEVEISEFYVEPFFKGQGIGRALIEEVIARTK